MKRTLFSLLAALVASPVFAGNLASDDWTTTCSEDHTHNFTFVDGNLVAHGGVTGGSAGSCDLLYKSAHKMENGSSLAITLQFASTQGLNDFTIGTSEQGLELFVCTSGNDFVLTHWDPIIGDWRAYTLSEADENSATLTLNFSVENDNLCYTYTFNGETKTSEKITAVERIDTIEWFGTTWQPYLGWDRDNATAVTVTEVTFTAPIPEPATTTLALLALAGLAARRRRK